MIDYITSKSAQREHEERVRSLTQVTDYDEWLKREAGHWQAPSLSTVLASLVMRLAAVAIRRKEQPEATSSIPLTVPEGGRVTS